MRAARPPGRYGGAGGYSVRQVIMSVIADARNSEEPYGKAIQVLNEALDSPDPAIKFAAARAMAEVRAKARADALKAVTGGEVVVDDDPEDNPELPRPRPVLVADAIDIVREHREAELAAKRGANSGSADADTDD